VHVELQAVSKRFGGVQALQGVDLKIERASIHGLVGENGAGKSTLGKVIAGVHVPDDGGMLVDGRAVHYRSPVDALRHGVTIVAQELALVASRTVIENVFLGIEPRRGPVVDARTMKARYAELDARIGFGLRATAPVETLRIADRQKVEILRALARGARLIVMDEPTAALTAEEAGRLHDTMRALRDEGTTIVYVSHFLDQVLDLAGQVTVLKDGRVVETGPAVDRTPRTLVSAMLGRSLDLTFPAKRFPAPDAPTRLAVDRLVRPGSAAEVSLQVKAGEIVGVAGLVGAGRSEIAHTIFGATRPKRGTITIDGQERAFRSPRDAIAAGIALIPESRKDQGLHMRRSIRENTTLSDLDRVSSAGVVRRRIEHKQASDSLDAVGLRRPNMSAPIEVLSGGNQQKALFGKWLFTKPRVLIADEPTRGVDIGAKLSIYQHLVELAAEGMAIVLISSELEEILGLAHRVVVMREGQVVAEFDGRTVTEDAVMRAAFQLSADQAGSG
jgi:simple sugar transport system ATP-binding protein/ribose transport system ATP-binding protein